MQQIHLHNTNAFTAPPRRLGRGEPASGETGSYPIFSLSRGRISIERHGPGEEHIKSLLPAALFE